MLFSRRIGMTKIKMCGLRRPEDIEYVNEVMPDYAGFIMSQRFSRSVTPQQQARLRAELAPGIKAVGVFVDEPVEYAAAIANSGAVDIVQFHGSESNEYVEQFRRLCGATTSAKAPDKWQAASGPAGLQQAASMLSASVIMAFRIRSADDLKLALLSAADYILLDSGTGSGICFDWELVGHELLFEHSTPECDPLAEQATCQTSCHSTPIFLAGGLDPDNVAEAINKVHPFAVDVSSGIETYGVKDRNKMIAFVEAVRNAACPKPCQKPQN